MSSKKESEGATEIEVKVGNVGASVAESARDLRSEGEELIRDVSSKAQAKFEEIRAEAGEFAGKAGETIREAAGTGKARAADALHGIADAVRTLAGKAEEAGAGAQTGDFARKAADSMDKLSDVLKDKSFEDLGEDMRQFVRERPAVAIGAAAVLGFALARMLKSSGDDGREA
ncbi:hypothetical protein [Thermaurantiacus sp.]